MRVVDVTWHDAGSRVTGWLSHDELADVGDEPHVVHTCGYLLKRTKRHLIVAMNASDSGYAADITTIPLGCVQSVRHLRGAR